jgi:DNA invertase Pin-like site-specific DNA recombinase
MRTREGMQVAKAKGRLRGKQPSSRRARRRTSSLYRTGEHTSAEPAERFDVARSTIYQRARHAAPAPDAA